MKSRIGPQGSDNKGTTTPSNSYFTLIQSLRIKKSNEKNVLGREDFPEPDKDPRSPRSSMSSF